MIYLIGGPGRSGKTTLAMRLNKRHGIAYFSLDYLMMGLYHGAPELEIDPNNSEVLVALRMWPVVKPLITAMLENGEEYCVEGFAVTPEHVQQLEERFSEDFRACFLGYCTADPERKLKQEREHKTTNPWSRDISQEAGIAEIKIMRNASVTLKNDCVNLGYEYFDTSTGFEKAINRAEMHLTGDHKSDSADT